MEDIAAGVVQLRAYLAQPGIRPNDRLPPERVFCEELGLSRVELRKALAVLEGEGAIWRHVGKGTFVGSPAAAPTTLSTDQISKRISPQEVIQARMTLEPALAWQAALNANAEQIETLHRITTGSRRAASWREYETLDNSFHRTIAECSQNTPLLAMFDQLNAMRRAVVWGRLRAKFDVPPVDHHSFAEHDAILAAVEDRDGPAARDAMQAHLVTVRRSLFDR